MDKNSWLALRKTVTEDKFLISKWQDAMEELNKNDRLAMLRVKAFYIDDNFYYLQKWEANKKLYAIPEPNEITQKIDTLIKTHGWANFRRELIKTIELEHRRLEIYDFNLMEKIESGLPAKLKYGS